MKSSDIREMTNEELVRAVDDNRRELFNLRLQAQTGQLENTARIRQVRRDIARLSTEQTARQKQANA
ncbi:MAG: 50S ribosomal protein L29 [Candidatus Pacebacteria bacterium]|nr:50S ribosomal protein L29 [Candidatus Paceibacterota bacterium]